MFLECSDANKVKKKKEYDKGRENILSRDYLRRKPLYNYDESFLRLCLDMIPHRS